ncbi:MAG: AMP-binding protein [Desulfomonile tiedjei]|nr:AMP-binding protein [Desulfomonile tiedjei]
MTLDNVREDARGNTLPKLLLSRQTRKEAGRVAIREKDLGIWQSYTWEEYWRQVRTFAAGLAALGFKRGDTLGVIGDNRPQLYWAQVATMCLGGIPVPMYQDAIEKELQYIIEHSNARIIVAEDQEQVDKMLALKERVPAIEIIIYDDPKGMRHYDHTHIKAFTQVQELGVEFDKQNPGYVDREIEKVQPDDIALIAYTSGTTGNPKGVVLSHANLITNARSLSSMEDHRPTDQIMAYLPMAWIGDGVLSIAMFLNTGFTVNCPEDPSTVMRDMREIGPTLLVCPPRIWENILSMVQVKMDDAWWPIRKAYDYFLNVGIEAVKLESAKKPVPLHLKVLRAVGKVVATSPLRDNLGLAKIRFAYTAGAAIGPEVFRFFRAIGVNLKQIYGLTETSAMCTYQPDSDVKLDTVGKPCVGVEIRVSDQGEVMIKSPGVFQGYYKNPEATAEALDQGWLHTGDAGIIDKDGHLKIIDRAKDVSVMATGTIFAPQYIENKLKFSQFVKEAVTLGQDKDYVAAMINIDAETVGNWAERRGIGFTSYTDLSQKPEIYDLIYEEVKKVNGLLFEEEQLRGAQIKRFLILHKELDPDDAEITRTRKIRRRFIAQKYEKLINALYSNQDRVNVEAVITYEDGRQATIRANLVIREVEIKN